jgi:hypothetical protein
MGIFPPPNLCYDHAATRLWLVTVMVVLTVMGIALLVQVWMLWRGVTQASIAWWQRLALVFPLVWVGFCAFDVVLAVVSYDNPWVEVLLGCPHGGRCTGLRRCLPPLVLRGPAQFAFIGATCLLLLGWLVLSALARRMRAV